MHGIEFTHLKSLSLNTPPGTKIRLCSPRVLNGAASGATVITMTGTLLLQEHTIELVGGVVPHLKEEWEVGLNLSHG